MSENAHGVELWGPRAGATLAISSGPRGRSSRCGRRRTG